MAPGSTPDWPPGTRGGATRPGRPVALRASRPRAGAAVPGGFRRRRHRSSEVRLGTGAILAVVAAVSGSLGALSLMGFERRSLGDPFWVGLTLGLAVSVLAFLGALAARARGGRVTVYPWQRGLLYRRGAFVRALPPGRHASHAFGREVFVVPAERAPVQVFAQETLSADGFPVKLGASAELRLADARRAFEAGRSGRAEEAMRLALSTGLRDAARARPLDALVAADRAALEAELAGPALREAAAEAGYELGRVALRDFILPAEVRRMLTEPERARREGLAALERARGETAALRSLANAARLMRGNPDLATLRVLQSLQAAPGRPAPTLVLGTPVAVPTTAAGATTAPAPAAAPPGPVDGAEEEAAASGPR